MRPVFIDSVGIVTPAAGDTSGSVGCMYVEARRFDDLPKIGSRGPVLVGAKTPIPNDVVGLDRLVQLGTQAIWEAVSAEVAESEIGLVVCAPSEADEPALAGQSEVFLSRLAAEAEVDIVPRASRVFPLGHSSIFEALPFALASIMQPDVAAVCILGVDSLVTKPRLRLFLERGGTIGSGRPSPGEAGAAVVLTRRQGASAHAMLLGLGVAKDRFLDQEGPPHPGRGMIAAIDRATAEAEVERPAFSGLACDMSGTSTDMEELAWVKTGSAFLGSSQLETVFPCLAAADAGAAMGVLVLATSAFLIRKSAWSELGLCSLSAPGQRGAAVLSPVPSEGDG